MTTARPACPARRMRTTARHLGDIVIARGVAARQAREARHALVHRTAHPRAARPAAPARLRPRTRCGRDGARREAALRRRGGLARASSNGPYEEHDSLGLFLLGLAAIYVGTVQAAFTALMRLPLRLSAARNDPSDLLVRYLEEPVMLFVPARIVQALILVLTGALLSLLFDVTKLHGFGMLILTGFAFAVICSARRAAADRPHQPAGGDGVPAAVVPRPDRASAAAHVRAGRPDAPRPRRRHRRAPQRRAAARSVASRQRQWKRRP